MIWRDQPTIFGDKIISAVSSIEDGPMNFKAGDEEEIRANRRAFLLGSDIDPQQTTLVQVAYEDTTSFVRYKVLDDEHVGEGLLEPHSVLVADALVATRPGQALFLPLADCIGAILYDTTNEILMVSHLGRHSIEQSGGRKSIEYLVEQFDSKPEDLLVWLSPAAGKENYPIFALKGKGLHEAVLEQMIGAGITPGNIEISLVDTSESLDYYSHSEFLKGNQSNDGRFAIVAMIS